MRAVGRRALHNRTLQVAWRRSRQLRGASLKHTTHGDTAPLWTHSPESARSLWAAEQSDTHLATLAF